MTVATEASYAEAVYTGAETIFTPGFAAQSAAHVICGYFDTSGLLVALTRGVHFSAALDAAGAVTVTKIAFPSASLTAPVTIAIERVTPAVQGTDFNNLAAYDAAVHELIADAGAMRAAELRNRQNRAITPFTASSSVVDFRPHTVRAAEPIVNSDLATKLYADTVSGSNAAAAAAAARDIAVANAALTAADRIATAGSAASAATSAAILGNPDYGFYVDAPTSSRDYGTYV